MPGPRLVRRNPPKPQVASEPVPHDQIAARAYELYEQEGCVHGHDLDHWLRAESELGYAVIAAAPVRRAAPSRTKRSSDVSV